MIIVVGIGGIIGATLRYLVGLAFMAPPGSFPAGTFIANMIGSFALAWLTATAARSPRLPKWVVTGLGTGTIGSFTTFSTFSVETSHLLQRGDVAMAFFYLVLSFLGGWALAFIGYKVGKGSEKKVMFK